MPSTADAAAPADPHTDPHTDADSAARWTVVARSDEVTSSPLRVEVDGRGFVLARTGERVLAARDRCPHRGAPLSAGHVGDGCLVCPYHGWRFDEHGVGVAVPALGADAPVPPKARLATVAVKEDRGEVAIAVPEEPPGTGEVFANDDLRLRRAWHPVCRSEEVAPGASFTIELLGERWHVERTADGHLSANDAHDVADHVGHIWLALDVPLVGLPEVPEHGDDAYRFVPMPRIEGRYGVGLLLDNQLDAGHFSFVHRNTFGAADRPSLPPYEVIGRDDGFDALVRVPITARNDVADAAEARPPDQFRNMTYRYLAPASLFILLDYEEMGGSTGILFCFTPLDRERTRVDVDLYFRHPDGFTDEQLAERLRFEIAVVGEDMALQDEFDFLELPLAPTAEVHTRADRAALAMRRIVTDLLARA